MIITGKRLINEISYADAVKNLELARLAFRGLNRKLRLASFETSVAKNHTANLSKKHYSSMAPRLQPLSLVTFYKEALKMNEKDILDILQKEKRYLQENFGLLSIGLFGSYSKGNYGPESDIDLLVELSEPRFDYLAGIQIYLEERIGKPVEVIRKRKDISDKFLSRIEKSIHYV